MTDWSGGDELIQELSVVGPEPDPIHGNTRPQPIPELYEVEYHLHIDVPNQPVFETVSRDLDEIVGFLLDWASQWGDQFSYGIVQNIVPREGSNENN